VGWAATRKIPLVARRALLGAFAKLYRIDINEAEKGVAAYETLQCFFTRRLKAGTRPIAQEQESVVAPSDGAICDTGVAQRGTMLEAKGSAFTIGELLGDPLSTKTHVDAPYVVIYLSPRDYHRVHSPVDGKIVGWTHIPGSLFPVGPASVAREPGLFAKNERFIIHIESEAGRCYVVMVAAVGVGHITCGFDLDVATHRKDFNQSDSPRHVNLPKPVSIEKGSELAIFNLGSTTITIFEPGRITLRDFQNASHVKMGEPIGRMMLR
jgi:phosphatidylserine decarboxylase